LTLDFTIANDLLLDHLCCLAKLGLGHFEALLARVLISNSVKLALDLSLMALEELLARIFHKLVIDSLGESHDIVEWDSFTLLDDLKLVFTKCCLQGLVLTRNLLHLFLAEDF